MMADISVADAEKSIKGIAIPPRPALLTEINNELQKAAPDINRLSARIAADVGLSAAVLKVINSPYFGLRSKVGSISMAVQLLGIQNVKSIVTGLLLKAAMSGGGISLERFWDSSEKVARIAAFVASTLPRAPRDEAYTLGLFRECGIPLLMQRFPEYMETLKLAAGDERPMVMIEDERHGTNHAVVGFMVARTWGLPETLTDALLRHHDPAVFDKNDKAASGVRTLVAINYLAEYLNDTVVRMRDNLQWKQVSDRVLSCLGINMGDLDELKDDVLNVLQAG